MKLVLVRWVDAWFDHEGKPGDWRAEYEVSTVGWLVRDEGTVSLAQETLPDGEFRAITHIPRSVVRDVVELIEEVEPS